MENKQNLLKKAIGQIVVEDFRTARIFKDHNIDFYFQGNRNIQEVVDEHNLDAEHLLNEIVDLQRVDIFENINFQSWPLDLLVDYIEKKHHRYVKKQIPILKTLLKNLCKIHGNDFPELYEVTEDFGRSANELTGYMENEEIFLFPAVREMVNAKNSGVKLTKSNFGSLQNPIRKMIEGHGKESQRFKRIMHLTNIYSASNNTDNVNVDAMKTLYEFEADLQTHIHLENNILFLNLKTLEKQLIGEKK